MAEAAAAGEAEASAHPQSGNGTAGQQRQGEDGQQQHDAYHWNYWNPNGNGTWWPTGGHRSHGGAWDSYSGNAWQPQWWSSSWQGQSWNQFPRGSDSDRRHEAATQQSSAGRGGEASAGNSQESHDAGRRQSASTFEEETWTGEATGSVDEGSRDEQSSSKTTAAKSGKDFIPEFDGTAPMREYQRRVNLFEISTTIDPSFRAQKLMEKLTGTAWLATESIPLETLKHPDGVKRLMDHLWKELEPLEFLRTFQTLADFYKGFRRQRGQEFVAYDMEFRRHNQRLEEIGAGLAGVTKAYWFLEKAGAFFRTSKASCGRGWRAVRLC